MSETPGKLLVAAREAQSLSQEEVAKRTRLSVSAISDIESDRYDHFGATTFVRGYLRSYARAVGVSEEKILSVWEASASGKEAKLSTPAPMVVDEISTGFSACQANACANAPSRSVVVVGALVVLGAVAWWINQKPAAPVVVSAVEMASKAQIATAPALPTAAPASAKPVQNTIKTTPQSINEKSGVANNNAPVTKPAKHSVAHHHHHKDTEQLHVTYTVKPVTADELASDH